MQLFLTVFITTFISINFYILFRDILNKKIPNICIILLGAMSPIYLYVYSFFYSFSYLQVLLNLSILTIIGFILYTFEIWGAGDAKYMSILSLYLPHISIGVFIGNIGIITLLYFFIYIIYFFFYKIPFQKKFREFMISNTQEEYKKLAPNIGNKLLENFILGYFTSFLIAIKLQEIQNIYILPSYVNIGAITFLMWFLAYFLIKKYPIRSIKIREFKYIFFISIGVILGYLILKNQALAGKIFYLYTIFLIMIMSFKSIFKIVFDIGESEYILYKNLLPGMILDKKYLLTQLKEIPEEIKSNIYLQEKDIKTLHDLYKKKGNLHLPYVKIIKYYSYGWVIFSGFCITLYYEETIIKKIGEFLSHNFF